MYNDPPMTTHTSK